MDFQALMKQAQLVQQRFHEAQEKMASETATGVSGGGLVKLVLKGNHQILSLSIDDSLMVAGETEVLGDLIRAAHQDAHKKLEGVNADLIKSITGELGAGGGLPQMPKFF